MSSIKKIFVRVKNGTNRWKLKKEVGGRGVERGGGVAEEGWGGGGGWGRRGGGGGSFLYFIPASHPYESTIYFSLFSYTSPLSFLGLHPTLSLPETLFVIGLMFSS